MMSSETERMQPPGSDDPADDTEFTLFPPGEKGVGTGDGDIAGKSALLKRSFSETVELNLGCHDSGKNLTGEKVSDAGKPAAPKAQVMGWTPVRSYRINTLKSCTYVKVAVDGAPYLRKVDLEMYDAYHQLLEALEKMFSCFTIRNYFGESKLMDRTNGTEYVPTYEDKDGDWMLVGDVPTQ